MEEHEGHAVDDASVSYRGSNHDVGPISYRVWTLCLVGFFVNCQPSEAYLTLYLKSVKQLTSEQLDNDVWPYDTYGSFAFLIPVGILAEMCGYRITIGIGLLCRELTRVLLLWSSGVDAMAAMQVTYAGATAVNTVYFSYIYMCVNREHFVQVTAVIHMAYYLGNAVGSLLGQLLFSYAGFQEQMSGLFYLSWGFTSLGTFIFVLFSPAPIHEAPESLVTLARSRGLMAVVDTVRAMYSESLVLLWSLWWLMGLGSHNMIANYYQTQFAEIDPSIGHSLGYVEFIMMLVSACAAMLPNAVAQALIRHSLLIILTSSALMGFLYYAATVWQSSIYYSYAFNISAISLYSFQYAAGSSVIAAQMHDQRYAILFTANSSFPMVFPPLSSRLHNKSRSPQTDTTTLQLCNNLLF